MTVKHDIMSILGLDLGYMVKYNPLPLGVPSHFALGKRVIFDPISFVSSLLNTDAVKTIVQTLICAIICCLPGCAEAVALISERSGGDNGEGRGLGRAGAQGQGAASLGGDAKTVLLLPGNAHHVLLVRYTGIYMLCQDSAFSAKWFLFKQLSSCACLMVNHGIIKNFPEINNFSVRETLTMKLQI